MREAIASLSLQGWRVQEEGGRGAGVFRMAFGARRARLYIFNAFISAAGTPEIAARYLAVFQVLISSVRVPPTTGWFCTGSSLSSPLPSLRRRSLSLVLVAEALLLARLLRSMFEDEEKKRRNKKNQQSNLQISRLCFFRFSGEEILLKR